MKNKARIKRVIVKYQLKDHGANPLTKRGRKWIKKEIKACNETSLRKALEAQKFSGNDNDYWDYVEMTGWRDSEGIVVESFLANPDTLCDGEIGYDNE